MLKKQMAIAMAAAGLMTAGSALAQSPDYRAPWRGDFWGYLGASAGESKYRSDCNRTITLFECDTKDTGWKVYAGGKINVELERLIRSGGAASDVRQMHTFLAVKAAEIARCRDWR